MTNEITSTETNLGQVVPGSRANLHYQLEPEEVQAEAHTAKFSAKLFAKIFAGSSQSDSLATVWLAGASCLIGGLATASGVPAMTAWIMGLIAAPAFFLMIRFTRKRRSGQG